VSDEPLRTSRDERGVVTLTLDRPEARNAFSAALMEAIADTVVALADDQDVRALVLTGSGTAFSAGADLNWMRSLVDNTFEENVADSRTFERMLRLVNDFPAPTLARVNGPAIGGAAGLLACTDVAVAVRGAKIGFSEARLGLAPAMISAYVQARIGPGHARRYFLSGELFDSDRALQMGLVHEVCDPDDLDATFERVLGAMLRAGPRAQRETKRMIAAVEEARSLDASEQLRLETIARLRVSEEGQEGMAAFFAKRPPSWVPEEG
jgi:methylglutaconyl-CoA hydratase